MGYRMQSKTIKQGTSTVYNFEMEFGSSMQEIVVKADDENPAIALMKKVIANKKINNREKLDAYEYEAYNKVEFDLNNITEAIGDKKGLTRYGHAYVPLDEALSRVVVDFSGRPGLHMDVNFTSGALGSLDTQLIYEFFQGFVNHALCTLHIDNLKGVNAHHQCETIFKAFARAIRAALELDPRSAGVIPSTKGSL